MHVSLLLCTSDLMLPGVVAEARGGCSLHGITKGEVCAVNVAGNRYTMGSPCASSGIIYSYTRQKKKKRVLFASVMVIAK